MELPIGMSGFSSIRSMNLIYVDKTDLIYTMLEESSRIFFARPRRFGKSLLVSTLEELFSGHAEHFKNLKIEKLWTDTEKYRVVHIDFSFIMLESTTEAMQTYFDEMLMMDFAKAGFTYNKDDFISPLGQLSSWLGKQDGDIVLLVDEYDSPLTENLENEELFSYAKRLLSEFFAVVKFRDNAFRLVFVTGIAKFGRDLTSMNQLVDISMKSRYGTLLGFTEDELEQYFGWFLDRSAQARHESVQELLYDMREMYGGWCFDDEAKARVYAPWSVLNFLSDNLEYMKPYWFLSAGSTSAVRSMMRAGLFARPEQMQREYSAWLAPLEGHPFSEKIGAIPLMFQTGYLSIKAADPCGAAASAKLGYPNKDVAEPMEQLRIEELTGSDTLAFLDRHSFFSALGEQKAGGVLEGLNSFFAAIVYEPCPIPDERTCIGLLYSLFAALGCTVLEGQSCSRESSALEVLTDAPHRQKAVHWVFELKHSKDGRDADALLQEAVQQLQTTEYCLPHCTCPVVKTALVFDGKKRQIVRWEQVQA